jgi:hypothetical protein
MAVLLSDLRTSAKVFANMQQSGFLTDPEWALLINKKYRALYAEVTVIDPQFRVTTSAPVNLTASANVITLAADFKGLLCVLKDPGTIYERILNPRGIRPTNDDLTYRIEASSIVIEPLQSAAGTFGYRYIPQITDLADPNGAMDVELEQFREFVELAAAIDAVASDEGDITSLGSLLGVETQRVRDWAKSRRKTDHEVIEDTAGRGRGNRRNWGVWP